MKLFEARLLTEGVRAIEGDSPNLSTPVSGDAEKTFETLLLERTQQLDQKLTISPLFAHFKKITKNTYTLLTLLLFVFGGLAVKNMLFGEQLTSVNFFWAFSLFFIPNILMFSAWFFLFFNSHLVQNSSLTRVCLLLIKQFERLFNKSQIKQKNYWVLFHCYFNTFFSQHLGRYQLSLLTHLLWLSYFAGAILMSVIMLATHQVDFIWQTSILSAQSFQMMTQMLAYLPDMLGFTVPSVEQIQLSHLSAKNTIGMEEIRLAWSSLLMSSLLLYGLVPRFILLVVLHYRFKVIKGQYQLNFSALYYVKLRQSLKPNKTTLGITDADDEIVIYDTQQARPTIGSSTQYPLPKNQYAIAIELSSMQLGIAIQHQHQCNVKQSETMVNVCDYQSQQNLLNDLQSSESRTVVLYLAVSRLPDRGLKRFISELMSNTNKEFHLLLISENKRSFAKQRDSDWYQLANEVGIKLDNIQHIEQQGSAK